MSRPKRSIFALVAPGLLIAATGVGAGDLATAGFSGIRLGTAVLWAVILGAALKLLLTEGVTRWQLTTGTTALEGAAARLGRFVPIVFLIYFLPWSYFTARALMSAAGAAGHAIAPILEDPEDDKVLQGIAHGLVAFVIVRFASFRLFERIMGVTIGVMFVTVIIAAVLVGPDWIGVARGLAVPTVPDAGGEGLDWTIALMGGVGGTVTILCYAYWIREDGRTSIDDLKTCRLDLTIAYSLTALFGIAMVIIASGIDEIGNGAALIVKLADRIEPSAGPLGRWAFLIGAWAAIFSSVLGVWQAVPYLFADIWRIIRTRANTDSAPVSTTSRTYRLFQIALVLVPITGLFTSFENAQRTYAIMGAFFLPMLAVVLLVLNTRKSWVGARHAMRPWTAVTLILTALFFAWYGYSKIT